MRCIESFYGQRLFVVRYFFPSARYICRRGALTPKDSGRAHVRGQAWDRGLSDAPIHFDRTPECGQEPAHRGEEESEMAGAMAPDTALSIFAEQRSVFCSRSLRP